MEKYLGIYQWVDEIHSIKLILIIDGLLHFSKKDKFYLIFSPFIACENCSQMTD